jgi:predicted kinase
MGGRLFIIRGNSASGKSTIAKKLQLELGYGTMLIPQDVIRREIVRVKDEPNNPAIELIKLTAMYGKKIGYNVILEGILSSNRYSAMIRDLVDEFGKNTYAYYYDVSFEETLRRHSLKPVASEYGEKQMREWWQEKDYLNIQQEKIISENMNIDDIIAMILSDADIR